MSSRLFTAKHVGVMAKVLDADYESVEDAAKAALDKALEIIVERAKFTVVGQVQQGDRQKIALGWYPTEKQALSDALSLAYSPMTHETALAWVLSIHNGSPASFYTDRKEAHQKAPDDYRERELARRTKWIEDNPGKPLPEEWGVSIPPKSATVPCPMCDGAGRIARE